MNRTMRRATQRDNGKEQIFTVTASQLHRIAKEKAKELLEQDLEKLRRDTIDFVFDLYKSSMIIAMHDSLGIGAKRRQRVIHKFESLVRAVESGEVKAKDIFEAVSDMEKRTLKIKI